MPIDAPRGRPSYRIGMADHRPDTGDPIFAANLAACRKAAGLSQADLGARIGREQNTVSGWETGRTKAELPEIRSCAKALGVTVDDLTGGPEAKLAKGAARFMKGLAKLSPAFWAKIDAMTDEEQRRLLETIRFHAVPKQSKKPPRRKPR